MSTATDISEHTTLLNSDDRPANVINSAHGHELPRTMSLTSATALVVGMMVGSGVFSTPGLVWMQMGSPGGAILLWLVGGLLAACGALGYAELGTRMPKNGGEQAYLAAMYPRPHLLLSYLFVWSSLFFRRPASLTTNAVAAGKYAVLALYGSTVDDHGTPYAMTERLVSYAYMALACVLVASSTRWTLRVQRVLSTAKLLLLLLIALAGLLVITGRLQYPSTDNWTDPWVGTTSDPHRLANALFQVAWAYSGWNTLAASLGELREPRRNLPLAMLGGIGVVVILYLLANVAFLAVVPAEEMAHAGQEVLAALFCRRLLGVAVGQRILTPVMALSAFGSSLSTVFAASRLLHAAALAGYLPTSAVGSDSRVNRLLSRLAQVHPRLGTPLTAVMVNMCLAMLLYTLAPAGDAFGFLITLIGYTESLFLALTVAGLLLVLRRRYATSPTHPYYFCAWTPALYLYLSVALFLCVYPWVPPIESGLPQPSLPYFLPPLSGLLAILTGVPIWYVMYVHRGSWHRACQALPLLGRWITSRS